MLRVRPLLLLFVVAGSAGCGASAGSSADAGPPQDAALGGRRSFDVVAVLTGTMANASQLPSTSIFTFVLDDDGAIAGGNGQGAFIGLSTPGAMTFQSTGPFVVGGPSDTCNALQDVRYDDFAVTIAGGTLTGTARGEADISCGDCTFVVPFTATLSGTSDATPPSLFGSGSGPATPFDSVSLSATEPLPTTATARIVADDGASLDLVPVIASSSSALPSVVAFLKPNVVLRAGHGYTVAFDGLVDFAGLVSPAGPPLRLGSFADAPTVPEDGFESATGPVLGGAMVMTGGPLPAISGATSLYIGVKNAPALDTGASRSLMVRRARLPGDTVLRFSYRHVALSAPTSFPGTLRFGSEGASPAPVVDSFVPGADPPQALTVAGQTLFASAVATMEATLPADATDDVLVLVAPTAFDCEPLVSQAVGMLIDDLRLE